MRTIDKDTRINTEWLPLQLMNGWVAYSSGDSPQYRIRNGVVEFRGAIKSGTTGAGSVVALLPLRTGQRAYQPVAVDNGASNVYSHLFLGLDGALTQDRGLAGNTFVSLSPLRFPLF